MYREYFGLKDKPFSITPDPRYLYLSPHHREALAHLLYGVTEGSGFVVLTGEVGTGKTTVSRCLVEQVPASVDVALVLNPSLTPVELLATICEELRIALPAPRHSLKNLTGVLNTHLLAAHAAGRRTVLLIDEAQNLSPRVLEQIRLLTNLETATQKLLQIILVGQPELNRMLARPNLRQLNQRVAASFHLRALTRVETSAYIAHRLAVCGRRSPLFSRGALSVLHRAAGGVPRVLNLLCDRALLGAYANDRQRVGSVIARRAVTEVLAARRLVRPWILALAPVLGLLGIVLLTLDRPLTWPPLLGDRQPRVQASGPVANDGAPPPTVSAPSTIETSTSLASLLAAARQRPHSAMTALLALWGVAERPPERQAPDCDAIQSAGLACLQGRGTWNRLREIDRPALLRLGKPGDDRYGVAVVALSGDRATLEAGGVRKEADIAEVDPYWLGDFIVPWRPLAPGFGLLRVGARGDGVLWLRGALAAAMGGPVPPTGDPGVLDSVLEAQVKGFQRRVGLSPDGVVGAQTLLQLTKITDLAEGPRLVSKR